MKKILIGADSRAIFPRPHEGGDWTTNLQEICKGEYEIHTIRAEYDYWLFSIYLLEEYLIGVPDNTYEYIFIQSGFHESVCFWPERVFESIVKGHFDNRFLKHPINRENMLALHPKFSPKTPKTIYMYDDIESAKKVFETFKKKAKNVIFVGMHSLKRENGLSREYGLGDKHHYDVLQMNENFSLLSTNSVEMPMNPSWIIENGYMNCSDGIHYNRKGTDFISSYIKRLINREDKTIPFILKNSKNNRVFYEKCIKRGSEIANTTNESDVVLISRRSIDDLMMEFVGCILFKRLPMVVQYPSSKVSVEEFDKKMNFVNVSLQPSLCICDEEFLQVFGKFFEVKSKLIDCEVKEVVPHNPEDVAFLQMSSGTTGDPKILSVTHRQLIANCDEYASTIGLNSASFIVSWLPLYHDMGLVAGFLLPLINDACFSIIDPFEWLRAPNKMLEMITKNKATHAWMPNFAFNYMSKNIDEIDSYDLTSLKKIISCSEPTFKDDLLGFYKKFKRIGLKRDMISVCYALAENVFAVSQSDSIHTTFYNGKEYVSCGKILPGISVLIVKDKKDVTEEEHGMVYIKSTTCPKINKQDSLFYGYYNTGDIGFMKNGNLYIIDRQKDSFVSYGINVYPSQVEKTLSDLMEIKSGRVACFGITNSDKGTKETHICAEVATETNNKDLEQKIMKKIKDAFGLSAKVHLRDVGFLVKTPSGKINRKSSACKVYTPKGEKLLTIVNSFLRSSNKKIVDYNDALFSSGLLDSIEFFELLVTLESNGIKLNRLKTSSNIRISIEEYDTVQKMIESIK